MEKSNTNIFDFFITIINGFFNLLKIEKISCIVILYLLYRDNYLVHKINSNVDVSGLLIDTGVISFIFTNDNYLIVVMGAIIGFLLFSLLVCIFVVRPMYLKEIDRLSEERRNLVHEKNTGDMDTIKVHRSSKKR